MICECGKGRRVCQEHPGQPSRSRQAIQAREDAMVAMTQADSVSVKDAAKVLHLTEKGAQLMAQRLAERGRIQIIDRKWLAAK